MKIGVIVKKVICYLIGLFLIALGINISKLSALGISPVSAIPRVLEVVFGFTLGTTTMIIYCILILLQLIILRKKFRWKNVLGIAVTFLFSFIIDLTGTDPKATGHLLAGFPKPSSYPVQLLYMLLAVFLIALGVVLYIKPDLVPMPAEGLAGAISEATGKSFGDCKTAVDVGMITIALILQLILLGGFSSFTGPNVVVREGTIILAVCIGQVVKLFSKLFGRQLGDFLNKCKS